MSRQGGLEMSRGKGLRMLSRGGGGGYLVLVYQEPRAIQSPLLLLPKLC